MTPDHLRIATRRSELAVTQARWVADRIRLANPGIDVELVEVVTMGDRDTTSPVTTLTEVGAFVRAVQQAVLEERADIAVHSCKDLPVAGPTELASVYPAREAPWDVLCGSSLQKLPGGARVGTGSPRRAAQLALIRPDLVIEGIRGNVNTRLGKVTSGEFDAVVLAEAGLRRIGLEHVIDHRFDLAEMVPAPAQAALAVETITDSAAARAVAAIDDPATRAAVVAERTVLAKTGAGCRSALGAYADAVDGAIEMAGFVQDEAGTRRAAVQDSAGRFGDLLGEVWMEPVYLPCIRIVKSPPEVLDPMRSAALDADWLVFTSRRALEIMWPEMMPSGPKIAAVGAATAVAVAAAGGRVTVTGKGGAAELCERLRGRVSGQTVVFPHAAGAGPETAEMLRSEGAEVVAAAAYETLSIAPAVDPVDAVILASPSAVAGWMMSRDLAGMVIAAMGRATAQAVRDCGFEPDVVPNVPGAGAIVSALYRHLNQFSERSSQ
jgi:hydroxymethylbilane synthase